MPTYLPLHTDKHFAHTPPSLRNRLPPFNPAAFDNKNCMRTNNTGPVRIAGSTCSSAWEATAPSATATHKVLTSDSGWLQHLELHFEAIWILVGFQQQSTPSLHRSSAKTQAEQHDFVVSVAHGFPMDEALLLAADFPKRVSFNTALSACAKSARWACGLAQLREPKFHPNVVTFNSGLAGWLGFANFAGVLCFCWDSRWYAGHIPCLTGQAASAPVTGHWPWRSLRSCKLVGSLSHGLLHQGTRLSPGNSS